MTGGDYERQLAQHLDELGYKVIRAPASGSATERDLPDLAWSQAISGPVCAELKTTSQNVAYWEPNEVESLKSFAAAFNASPLLVARFKGDTDFYALRPGEARKTDSGKYAYDRDMDVGVIL